MPRKLLLSATAAVLVVAAAATGGIVAATARAASIPGNVFVSPSGKDSNPGTQSAPVKTVQRAQQLVRALNDNMSADVTVVLYYKHNVKANYAFKKGELKDKDIEKIVKDLSKILPEKKKASE